MTDARRNSTYIYLLFTEDRGCTDHVDNVQLFLKHLDENLGEEQKQIVSAKSCEYFSTKNAGLLLSRVPETAYLTETATLPVFLAKSLRLKKIT